MQPLAPIKADRMVSAANPKGVGHGHRSAAATPNLGWCRLGQVAKAIQMSAKILLLAPDERGVLGECLEENPSGRRLV